MCDPGNLELKNALTELGLYETGMLMTDMRELLNTINQSKNSATMESEYRKLASDSKLELIEKSRDETIIEEILHKVDEQETKSLRKLKKNKAAIITDDIFDKLKEDKIDEIFPISQNKNESDQSDDFRETKSNYFRETRAKTKLSQKMHDALDETKSDEASTSNYDVPCESSKTNELTSNKVIDVSLVDNNYKPLKLKVPDITVKPNVYYHPVILNLPYDIRAQVIFKFHLFQMVKYKHFYPTEFMESNSWSETIKPSITFNDNLCVDYVPDVSDEDITENHVADVSSVNSDINSTSKRKSNRQIKRKCYIESYSSDDDDFAKNSKKTRSNCMTLKNVTINKSIESKSIENENKWRANVKPAARPSLLSYANDRTKKIMSNVESLQEKPKTMKKNQENMELTDDEDDMFNEMKITVDVHDVSTPIKDAKSSLNKNPFSRCRSLTKKRENPKASNDDDEILVDNSVSEITTNRFYKTRNQEEKTDNIASTSESMTECPICLQLFKMSVIESHASVCDQFNEPTSKCTICKMEIPQSEMKTHEDKCINDLCESDKETDEDEIKTCRLCSVCDKYFSDGAKYKTHLKKCIASLNGQ